MEDSTSKTTWRYPTDRDALYFDRLAAWGYAPSEVEQIVTGSDDCNASDIAISTM